MYPGEAQRLIDSEFALHEARQVRLGEMFAEFGEPAQMIAPRPKRPAPTLEETLAEKERLDRKWRDEEAAWKRGENPWGEQPIST